LRFDIIRRRGKKEEGRRKKEEGRGKKEETWFLGDKI
jgi:hypothetical protein